VQPRELRADLNDLQSLGWLSFTTDRHGTTIQLREPGEAEQPQEEKPASGAATEGMEPFQVKNTASPDRALIHQFSAIYNLHRPSTWPSHEPSDSPSLGRLVQQAIDRAGSREAFWSVLKQALKVMPAFWRTTYRQGRSGADCARALFRCDQSCQLHPSADAAADLKHQLIAPADQHLWPVDLSSKLDDDER